jgi:hypothetical protein
MAELAFIDDFKLFDGECVRFHGHDGKNELLCGVTTAALKRCESRLPSTGLVPAEEFLAAYERWMTSIHLAARAKHAAGKLESEGPLKILVRRDDIAS